MNNNIDLLIKSVRAAALQHDTTRHDTPRQAQAGIAIAGHAGQDPYPSSPEHPGPPLVQNTTGSLRGLRWLSTYT
jgi:hypothetical protein